MTGLFSEAVALERYPDNVKNEELSKDIGIEKNESGFIGKLNRIKWQSNPLYFAI